MMLSVLVWLAMQGQVQAPHKPVHSKSQPIYAAVPLCYGGAAWNVNKQKWEDVACLPTIDAQCPNGSYRCADCTCIEPPKPAEHVIEIKTVREDQAATCKIDHLHDEYPGYNLRDLKSCVCSEESYASGYRISYQYGDYTSGIGYSTPDLADPIKCVRVTRELWIDNVKFGIIKGLD